MALINCSECGKQISDKAISCPDCGMVINSTNTSIPTQLSNGQLTKPVKKKRSGCLVAISIFFTFFLFVAIFMSIIGYVAQMSVKNVNTSKENSVNNTTAEYSKNIKKEISENNWEDAIVDVNSMSDETGIAYFVTVSDAVNWNTQTFYFQGQFAQNIIQHCLNLAKDANFDTCSVVGQSEGEQTLFIGSPYGTIHLWINNRPKDKWEWD